MNHPDPKKHLHISLVKSYLRIIGCVVFPMSILGGAILFGLAEVLGIVEECV